VAGFFATAAAGDFGGVDDDYADEVDKNHGRMEVRRHRTIQAPSTLSDA
jgi:hypothetical protein